ncbi:MAG: hypothetical protein ACT4ON_00230 [Bacteroidota bacterium]
MRYLYSILFTLIAFVAFAQAPTGMFESRGAHVVITGQLNSSTIVAESNSLIVLLNCDNSEVLIKLDLNTIYTGVHEFDRLLSASRGVASFKGKMDVDFIESDFLSPIQFETEGSLTLNNISRPVIIKSGINYIGGNNSGILSGTFPISLYEFNLIPMMPPRFSDQLMVQFSQVVMRRVCE